MQHEAGVAQTLAAGKVQLGSMGAAFQQRYANPIVTSIKTTLQSIILLKVQCVHAVRDGSVKALCHRTRSM